jgi:NADH:ubiquinone oxidoreductase subunit H
MPYFVLLIKILLICAFAIATRGTLPRYRFDQFTQINWKNFIFLWLIILFFNVFYYIIFLF